MTITNYLRKLSYRPDLCDGVYDKYQKTLKNYLGQDRYMEYCDLVDTATSEDEMNEFAENDLKLLKLFISSQIKISIEFTELIIFNLKKIGLLPGKILDLGGSDGWSSNYIKKKLKLNSQITVVDKNNLFNPVENNIIHECISYANFKPEEKFDLVISILGATMNNIKELFNCIDRSLSKDGIVFLGLRISNNLDYIKFIDLADNLGFSLNNKYCEKISIYYQQLPFMCLSRAENKITSNEKLILSRKGFFNLKNPKRVYGYEAKMIENLINDNQLIEEEIHNFEDGSYFKVEIIEKNNIIYRKSYNSYGDLIIEYPVDKKDDGNKLKNQLEKCSSENLFNNTL